MPTYEYACRDCSEHIEVVQSFRDEPLDTCGLCGGALRKVFSAAGIIFKGSGYYVTDTRGKDGDGKDGKERKDKATPATGKTGSEKADNNKPETATKRDSSAAPAAESA